MKTFLELVNGAISEAKATLDPLTSANFADPPRTMLYNKFKEWVNRAYKELLLDRNEWFFQKERTVTSIGPRIHVVANDASYVPLVGDILRGQSSQFDVVVTAVNTFEDDEQSPTILEYTLDIVLPDGNRIADFAVSELIDVVGPTPQVGAFTYQGPGFYSGIAPSFRPDKWKVTIFDPLTSFTPPGTNTAGALPLIPVPWNTWTAYNFQWTNTGERPIYVSQNPEGLFAFYPQPAEIYPIEVYYSRGQEEMVEWDDTPVGFPEQFEDYIMWKAVEEFADFDSNTRLYARANKKVEKYRYWLERDEMPDVTIGRSKFDRTNRYNT